MQFLKICGNLCLFFFGIYLWLFTLYPAQLYIEHYDFIVWYIYLIFICIFSLLEQSSIVKVITMLGIWDIWFPLYWNENGINYGFNSTLYQFLFHHNYILMLYSMLKVMICIVMIRYSIQNLKKLNNSNIRQ